MQKRYGRLDGEIVLEVWDFRPDLAEGLTAIELPPEVEPNWRRDGDGFVAPELPDLRAFVPASVSSAQAKIALVRAGHIPAVKAAIEALGDEEAAIWFTDARTWERSSPYVGKIAEALGLSDAETDALFIAAALIAA